MKKENGTTLRPSFLRRLFFSLFALVLTVTIILSGVLITSYYRSSYKLINKFFDDLLMQSNYSITYVNEIAQQLQSSLHYDRNVVPFLYMKENDSLQIILANRAVNQYTLPLPYVNSVYLYNKQLDLVLSTKTGEQSSLSRFYDGPVAKYLKNYADPHGRKAPPVVHEVSHGGSPDFVYSYIVPEYNYEGDFIAAIVINVSVDVLTQSLQAINSSHGETKFIVTDGAGRFICPSPFQEQAENADLQQLVAEVAASGQDSGNTTATIGGTKFLLSYNNSNSNGWYMFGMAPHAVIFKDLLDSAVRILLFLFGMFLLSALLTMLLAKRLGRPIRVISRLVKGETLEEKEKLALNSAEFNYMASVFTAMQRENDAFSAYKSETGRFARQEILEGVICGTATDSSEKAQEHLKALGCGFMLTEPLCMCLLSIDHYQRFTVTNNQRERWALRFAVLNLSAELLSQICPCEILRRGPDKFIAILNCRERKDYTQLAALLEKTLAEIISHTTEQLGFSLTAAYSTLFTGVGHLQHIYENLDELLLLKVRHGHGKVLNPHMAEDVDLADFHVSFAAETLLVNSIVGCKAQQALLQFRELTADLFRYGYNEIISYLVHLSYRIFSSAKESLPAAGSDLSEEFKRIMTLLPQCEVEGDFSQRFSAYLENTCNILTEKKNSPKNQSSYVLVEKVLQILDSRYGKPDLCLNAIADELGFSAHYIGQIFREAEGKSVAKYLLELRLEKIAALLRETEYPFAKILQEVGFEEEQKNYIYTCFKKHFGLTVKNYQKQVSSNGRDTP